MSKNYPATQLDSDVQDAVCPWCCDTGKTTCGSCGGDGVEKVCPGSKEDDLDEDGYVLPCARCGGTGEDGECIGCAPDDEDWLEEPWSAE